MNGSPCASLHPLVDTFLDNELDCDQSLAFSLHLGECPELKQLVATRKAMRDRLRAVVRSTDLSPGLETRIRARLSDQSPNRWIRWNVLHVFALAAVVLLALGVNNVWRNGGLRLTPASQEAYIASLRPGLSPIMQVGLQQHVHCAVYHKLTSPLPTLEEMARALGPNDGDLVPAMQRHLPQGFQVVQAHQCDYHGRGYIHLTATDSTRLISLLITNREQGEAFENDLRAVATESNEPVYASTAQRFGIAGFETRDHLVYLVSDLDAARNLGALEGMAQEVARTIRTHEI